MHKMGVEKYQMQSKSGTRELNNNGKRDLKNLHEVKKRRLTAHQYKKIWRANTSDYLLGRDGYVTEAHNSSKGGQVISEKPNTSCEERSIIHSPCKKTCERKQKSCSDHATQSFHDDEKETPVVNLNSSGAYEHHAHLALQGIGIEGEQKKCITCGHGGQLLCCAGQGCSRSFHLSCIKPPFTYVPPGVWHCIWCIKRKIDMDVYAVSEGIESVLDVRNEVSDGEVVTGMQKEKKYLVKYKGLAHIHNRWVAGKTLVLEAPALFSRYKQKNKKVSWKKEWSVPERLLAKRFLVFPEQCNSTSHENNDCHYEWLVKWTGLGYDHATWELENASFLRTSEALKLINDFEVRQKKAVHFEEDKRRRTAFSELDIPFGCQDHLIYVNKLRGYWHKDQNALVIDDQERVLRVVFFVLSLLEETRGPFLIVTTSNALSTWEAEFSRCGSHANVIVYKGSKIVRSIIRTFEFYNENGGIMFQVLVSCGADVAEDIENFKNMNWKAVILDECQRPTILPHFDQIKLLATNMRLLLVSSQIKDWNFNYHGVLCLLDPKYDEAEADILDADPSINTCKLKDRLVDFIAYECQSETTKLVEFWVPVMLTDVQIEQYCASLFSASMLLCSSLKCDSTVSLHEILVSTRKCCDHPFLVDRSLRSVVLKGVPAADHFDVEIQLSRKLQLLNKLLSEIERRGLRIVIFFQSLGGSGMISLGDILDDFIHQKIGKDTYIRIDGNISRSKKQAACDMFNSKDSRKFVCLIEARACVPSTKLSSVDTIVIFNSDWDPMNDLKALQKITIDSKFEQINIFRLYCSCTVEEKVLILAKEGVSLDSNIKNINRSICHKLLSWGASCLFTKIDGSIEFSASASNLINTFEQTLLEDVFQEVLSLLSHSSGKCDSTDNSIINPKCINVLKVQQSGGTYLGRFSLNGELIVQSMDNFSIVRRLIDTEPPHIFWKNLLEGRQPRWKYKSSPMQRIKRKNKYLDDLPDETDHVEEATKSGRTESKRTRNSATKRYRCVNNLVNSFPPIACALRGAGTSRDYDRSVKQHCEAVNLSTMGTSNSNNSPGGEPDSLPDELPLSSNSASAGDNVVDASISISRGVHDGHTNLTGSFGCQGQAPMDTSTQGSACMFITSIQQLIQNLSPQPSATYIDRSKLDAASLQHQNTVPHSSSFHPIQKHMETMQEAKEQAVKLHNDLKLHFKSEREKEIEEIHKKYDLLIQNSERAMAETRSCFEACYNLVHKQKLLADATLQKDNLASAAGPHGKHERLSPENLRAQRVSNLSAIQPAATRDPGIPEQDSMGLQAAVPPPVSSVQVLRQSSENPQSCARTGAGKDQSSADLGIISSSSTPSEPMHTSHPGPRSIPTISIPGNLNYGRALRAPAPHLRHTRPPPAVSAPDVNPSSM